MPFIEYINQQLNPTFDADMQHAMNWGLAPGFPRVSGMQIASSRQLPWQKTKATPKTAKQAYAPKQSRTAASSGRMQQSKPPSRNIPTLPTPKPQAAPPVAPPMNAQPAGPYMPAFGDEAPGMVAFEDAGFAPPMTPQMDLSQAMPFGGNIPMEYADMPMPEMAPAPSGFSEDIQFNRAHPTIGRGAAITSADDYSKALGLSAKDWGWLNVGEGGFPLGMDVNKFGETFAESVGSAMARRRDNPLYVLPGQPPGPSVAQDYDLFDEYTNRGDMFRGQPQAPVLQLGLGRNVSPWGVVDTGIHVKASGMQDAGFTKGKAQQGDWDSAGGGFVGPGGGIIGQRNVANMPDYVSLPAAALPMEAAPAVAAGLQGEAFDDELPMPTNPIDRDAMRQQMQAIQMQRDAYEGQMRQERYNNWFRNLGSALSGMGPSTKSFRPAHQAMLNMQRNDANFNNFMRGGMNAQHQLNQDERQLYRDYYNAQHQYNQDVYGRDRALTGRRQADAAARNADTAEKRFGESVRSNKERERLTQEQRDELRRHNQVSEENARNDDMRAMNDSALKAMADAMKMRQQHEDKVADRQSREGIASANRKAASDLFGKKQDAKESGALKGEKRKQLRKFQAVLTKRDKKTDVGAMLDAMNSMATQEQYSKAMAQVKASPAYSQARTKEEKYHMFAQALNSMLLDDGPDEEPDDDADD